MPTPRYVSSRLRTRPLPRQLAAMLSLVALALFATGCGRSRPPKARNVLLIVVDTLRADHLGTYGYERDTSPWLDRWVQSGTLFTQARSQASCTFPSVNTILTGRHPQPFLLQPGGRMGIPEGIPTLAELLADRGFATYAISASPIVRKTASKFNPHGGFDRGFQRFDESNEWKSARNVRRSALRLLATHDPERPFFLYLHFMDPHGPFNPPQSYRRQFATQRTGVDAIDRGNIEAVADHHYNGTPLPGWDRGLMQHLVDLYDDEIRYLDGELARLFRALAARKLLADTLVVFAADHGEEFLEHDEVKHCRSVFDTEVRVPLVFVGPGVEPRRRAGAPVMNIDITPTVLDLLDIAGDGFDGRSLRPQLRGEKATPPHPFTVSSQGVLRGLADERHKLVLSFGGGAPRLFDLVTDPGETRDLAAAQPAVTRRLRASLRRWHQSFEQGDEARAVAAARETEKQLKALGYLQ